MNTEKDLKLNKRIKRISVAAVLLLVSIFALIVDANHLFNEMNAAALDESVSIVDNTCAINSADDFVAFSKAYQTYPDEYQNVNIYFAITSGTLSNLDEFVSIGTADYPFAGNIVAGSTDINITLDKPLFDYVMDSCGIKNSGGNSKAITLSRSGSYDTPLFAANVVHDAESTGGARWEIGISEYVDSLGGEYTYSFAGVIGSLGKDAEVELVLNNNAVASNGSCSDIVSDSDVGLACKVMNPGSKLTVSVSGASTAFNVSSANGSAGGLVGTMSSGSSLIINSAFATGGTVSAGNYAGGLVGYATDASVTFSDPSYNAISPTAAGKSGTGGVFGYYRNTASDFAVTGYNVDCTLNGAYSGGIFGELVNGGTMTVDGSNDVTVSRTSIDSTYTNKDIGGLIGKYSSETSACVLAVDGVSVNIGKSASADNYGGMIGVINDDSYVHFSNVTVNAASCNTDISGSFGGLVGDNTNAFIDAENVTIKTDGEFYGGGVVGNMRSGVLRFIGKTDLSGAKAGYSSSIKCGQIVGARGQALIYAQSGWKLIRSSAVTIDDIGSWGEVLRFNDSGFTADSVLSVDETKHIVTVKPANTTVLSLSEFAALALNIQLNSGNVGTLQFDSGSKNSVDLLKESISLGCDIDLTGTGITGLTRDDGTNDVFTGTFDGGSHKLTLAIGEAYGFRGNESTAVTASEDGNGIIYRHNYNALFAKTGSNAAFKNLYLDGSISVDVKDTQNNTSAGGLSAEHMLGAISFDNINSAEIINMKGSSGSKYAFAGGLAGKTLENPSSLKINVNNCTIGAEITNSGSTNFLTGGAFADICTTYSFEVNADNVIVSAKITNTNTGTSNKAGGLIANISNYGNSASTGTRTISLTNITIDGTEVTGGGTEGSGLLGEAWNNAVVTVGGADGAKGITVKNSTISQSGGGHFGGLLRAATGYWKVYDITIESITVKGTSANSFGMFINNGLYSDYNKTYALYLELENESAYTIGSADLSGLKSSAVFDELVATCTGNYSADVCENKRAVVSVHTGSGLVTMDGAGCNTYQNQSGKNTLNKNTRYYYNLDVIRGKDAASLTAPEKLMLWSVYNYAYDNLRQYFTNPITTANNSIPAGVYDMTGYSYYPIDASSDITIANGCKFVFANSEIENGESGTGNSDGMARSTVSTSSQHYLMHCGLLRNVSAALTVNGAEFSGSVGNFGGSGALICGAASGSTSAQLTISVKNIILNGIKVSSLGGDYAPLLINKIGGYIKATVSDVSAVGSAYADTAATSLIGDVGGSDADNIKITFNKIALDARISADGNTALDTAYGTQKSIFSKATLLNSFVYQSGMSCSAVYNYKYEEDWSLTGTPVHKVTYGKEVSGSVEYVDLQRQYIDAEYYTDPENAESESPYDFSAFLPYVAAAYDSSANCHEIKVNQRNKANLDEGCGTYNDPYIINNADQIALIAELLNGEAPSADGLIVNYYSDNYSSWCENKTEHTIYTWVGDTSSFVDESSNEISLSDIQTALSTAYYKLNKDITLPESFIGIGKTIPFKGVIYGAGHTVTNQNVNPFIYQSTGSVIKDLNVNVTAEFTTTSYSAGSKYLTDGGTAYFYGGLIGIVNGGDNIIDKVSVTFEHSDTIYVNGGSYWGNTAVGGYIGVLRYGGVIFRNMEGIDHSGIVDNANKDFSAAADNKFKGSDGKTRLFFNHIIGRVISGYAVTETDKYEYSEQNVTMKNGTKNYSIADIDRNGGQLSFSNFEHPTGKSSISAGTVTVPDAQALFLMGCISSSGAGSASLNGAYPSSYSYGNGSMVRYADYDKIGTDDASDYAAARNDNFVTDKNAVPYIIYRYTTASVMSADGKTSVSYPARSMTNNKCVFNIVLSGGTYNMPDGFRGIGSLESNSDELEMYIYGIKGNGSVIDLNMALYTYRYDFDFYFRPNGWQNYKVGLGLFNALIQNKSTVTPTSFASDATGKYVISDLTISGNVTYEIYQDENSVIYYNEKGYSGCAGGLAGTSNSCSPQIKNVTMTDLNVVARQVSGGLIGAVNSSTVSISGCNAENLSVNGGFWAGGLIGFSKTLTISLNGSASNGTSGVLRNVLISSASGKSSYNDGMGAGGLLCYVFQNSNIKIKNIDIEGGSISSAGATTFVGGIIGCCGNGNSVDVNIDVSNVNVKNVDIDKEVSVTAYNGGFIGILKQSVSQCNISSSHVIGSTDSKNYVCGGIQAGGFVGLVLGDLTVDNCSVENYIIKTSGSSVECAGGFFAKTEVVNSSTSNVVLKNSKISDCVIQQGNTSKPVGGIVGHCVKNMKLNGYNIVSDNVQITDGNGNELSSKTYAGDIAGRLENGYVNLVGLCMNKTDSGIYAGKNVGTISGSCFVICADYDGKCLEADAGSSAPTFNTDADVSDMGSYPYATVNPSLQVDASNILTGDGVSSTAVINIMNDIDSGSAKAYKNIGATDRATFGNYTAKLSTFKTKTGADAGDDFPVLVVNESNYSHVTDMINSYIHLLTNDCSISNYANADSGICSVDISSYMLNGTVFEKQTGTSTLEMKNGYFRMTDTDYDSSYDNRFTLIDISYYAPNDTSSVAYHLYIPVYVEKMLKFDFRAAALSGTKYNTSFYTDGNPVLESYGTPVTVHITYSYRRTVQEWQDAINSSENVLKGYGKSILLKGNNDLPSGTMLVLVDKNNSDKAYYSSIGTAFSTSDKKLDFGKFNASDGTTAFTPVSFAELLSGSADITVKADTGGSLVKCAADEISQATLKVGDDYYRKKTDLDTDTSVLYSVTVTAKDNMVGENGILKVEEEYYISFFTEEGSDLPMRNIAISCNSRLGDDNMTPSRLNNINSEESIVHMILGNLYDQTFTFTTTGDEVINENNNKITADLNTTVSLKPENADEVKAYLNYKSIHLYHGFIIEAARTDDDVTEKGVKGSPQVSGTYTVGGSSYGISFNNTDSVIKIIGSDGSGAVDIKQQLISGGSVTISCKELRIIYTDDTSIIEQFPERVSESSDNGVVYSASSNLAYVEDNIEQSNITASPSVPDGKKYYRENIAAASLKYNVPSNSPNELITFGINGLETNGRITAVGYYNVLNIPEEELNKAAQVKFALYLYQKNADGSYVPVSIDEYLEDVKLEAVSGTLNNVNGVNVYDFTFNKDELNFEAGSFEVKSTYYVKTGADFESESRIYANYKVQLSAQLLDQNGEVIINSGCSDHIIYTNARIYTKMVSVN